MRRESAYFPSAFLQQNREERRWLQVVVRKQLGPGMGDQAIVVKNNESPMPDIFIMNMPNSYKNAKNAKNSQYAKCACLIWYIY